MNSRRQFIKNSCLACMGMGSLATLLTACGSTQAVFTPLQDKRKLVVPKEKFAATSSIIVKNKLLEFTILLVKNNNSFKALQMRCTHNDVALSFTGKKLLCHAHGSEFDLNGKVIKDPAPKSLTEYPISEDAQNIYIHI